MAYNTKPLITDKDGNPISQYYNPDTDQYEPVQGVGGGNRVIVYKSDGTESSVSLLPILEKLEQLTGTVIDETTRKSSELQRVALYNQMVLLRNRVDNLLSVFEQVNSDEVLGIIANLETLYNEMSGHLTSTMPHQIKDLKENKAYQFGLQLSEDGSPQIIYEEVM